MSAPYNGQSCTRAAAAGSGGGGNFRGASAVAAAAAPPTSQRLNRLTQATARPARRQDSWGASGMHQQAAQATRAGSATLAAAAGGEVAATSGAQAGSASSGGKYDELVEDLIAFLKEDLQHLFDDQGIDASKYDPEVVFEDPITYYNNVQGYLFNIKMLKNVFAPRFILHDVRRTGELEVTTRWTMSMCLALAKSGPLRRVFDPRLTFTGTSIMGINPDTGRFNRHSDTWDAVQQQRYFSFEAFKHMLGQVFDLRKGPAAAADGEQQQSGGSQAPVVLLKRKQYEVRRYASCPPARPQGSGAASSSDSGVYAVADFSGEAWQQRAQQAQQALRKALAADGLQPAGSGWLLAAGDVAAATPLLRRNEVFIPLEQFALW